MAGLPETFLAGLTKAPGPAVSERLFSKAESLEAGRACQRARGLQAPRAALRDQKALSSARIKNIFKAHQKKLL